MKSFSLPAVILLSLMIALVGPAPCGGNGEVSYSRDVQPIFSTNCAFSGCHDHLTMSGGLNLEANASYENIVNVPSTETALDRIEPGDPDQSYLYLKLTGDYVNVPGGEGTGRMPLNGPPLPDDDIETIESWILDGAPDN